MGKNFFGGQELAVVIACLTTHYPLEPIPSTHTHTWLLTIGNALFIHSIRYSHRVFQIAEFLPAGREIALKGIWKIQCFEKICCCLNELDQTRHVMQREALLTRVWFWLSPWPFGTFYEMPLKLSWMTPFLSHCVPYYGISTVSC